MRSFLLAAALAGAVTAPAAAEIYKDYTPSKEVWNVTYVHVKPSKVDTYLMGLKQTWVPSCEEQKKAGIALDCFIMVSTTSSNRDFNVMLVIKAPNAAAGDPNPALYQKITAALSARLAQDKRDQLVVGYEEMRTFWGEQDFRMVEFK